MNNQLMFTEILYRFLSAGLSLKTALAELQRMKGIPSDVIMCAAQVLQKLEYGTALSTALEQNDFIRFEKDYCAIISVSELSGNLCEAFEFLLSQLKKTDDRKKKISAVCVYPSFIIMLCFVAGILMLLFGPDFAKDICIDFNKEVFMKNATEGLIIADVFLLAATVFGILLVKNNLGINERYEIFKCMTFLLKAGIDVRLSLAACISSLPQKSAWRGKIFFILDELNKGKSAGSAFVKFGNEYKVFFEIQQNCGKLSDAFVSISKFEEERIERKEKIFLSLVEPFCILTAAVYLLILVQKILMPVLYSFNLTI